MAHVAPTPEPGYLALARAHIYKSGWALTLMAPEESGAGCPRYGYTTGLAASFGHPDLAIFGLPAQLTQGLAGRAVAYLTQNGPLRPETRYAHLLPGHTVAVREISDGRVRAMFPVTAALSNHPSVLWLAWSDEAGSLPWDSECVKACQDAQQFMP